MPIRKGDGTGISDLRLGDGTGIAELRKGDGTVLWSAGGAIPDSGTEHQWLFDEGSGTTVNDFKGTADGNVNGATWESNSDAVGGYWLSFDGTNDGVHVSDNVLTSPPYTFVATIRTTDDSTARQIGHSDISPNWRFEIQGGNLDFNMVGDSNISGSYVADGNLHRVGVSYDGSTFIIALDGSEDLNVSRNYNSHPDNDLYIGTLSRGDDSWNGIIDNPAMDTNEAWTGADFAEDYNSQPWS